MRFLSLLILMLSFPLQAAAEPLPTDFQPLPAIDGAHRYIPLRPVVLDARGNETPDGPELIDAGSQIMVSARLALRTRPDFLEAWFNTTNETEIHRVSPRSFSLDLFRGETTLWQRPDRNGSIEQIPLQFMLAKPEKTGPVELNLAVEIEWPEKTTPLDLQLRMDLEAFIRLVTGEVHAGQFTVEKLYDALQTARQDGIIQFKGDRSVISGGLPPVVLSLLTRQLNSKVFQFQGIRSGKTTDTVSRGLVFRSEQSETSDHLQIDFKTVDTLSRKRTAVFPFILEIPESLIQTSEVLITPTPPVTPATPGNSGESRAEIMAAIQAIEKEQDELQSEIRRIKKEMAGAGSRTERKALQEHYLKLKKQVIEGKKKQTLLKRKLN